MFTSELFLICFVGYFIGAAALAGYLYVQHMEKKQRPEGYHVKATLTKIVDQGDRRQLYFSFFLNGQPIKCSASATKEESASAKKDRDYLIVYNAQTKECFFNPCAKSRKAQLILAIVSFLAIAFATLLILQVYSLSIGR